MSTNSILIIITINSWAADCNRVSLSKNSNIVLSKLHLNSFPFVRYPVVVSTLFLFNPAFYYYEMKKCIFWPRVHDRFILFFFKYFASAKWDEIIYCLFTRYFFSVFWEGQKNLELSATLIWHYYFWLWNKHSTTFISFEHVGQTLEKWLRHQDLTRKMSLD